MVSIKTLLVLKVWLYKSDKINLFKLSRDRSVIFFLYVGVIKVFLWQVYFPCFTNIGIILFNAFFFVFNYLYSRPSEYDIKLKWPSPEILCPVV
jgi:hypothetical protein